MKLGIGTGSTVFWFIQALADRVKREGLDFAGVGTSRETVRLAEAAGIRMLPLNQLRHLDLAVDGADEVDPKGRLIKGGGGALVRERLVAASADRFVVITDASKTVDMLGAFAVPIEVIPFGYLTTAARIQRLNVEPVLRMQGGEPFVTDNGNYILDTRFGTISDPSDLYRQLKMLSGVVDAGIFAEFSPTVLTAHQGTVVSHTFG